MRINTILGVDIKTLLQSDGLMVSGKQYHGVLTRDFESEECGRYDEHLTFVETLPSIPTKRNDRVFVGRHITVTRREDGSLRLNFRPLKVDRNFLADKYALQVANEITEALEGFVRK